MAHQNSPQAALGSVKGPDPGCASGTLSWPPHEVLRALVPVKVQQWDRSSLASGGSCLRQDSCLTASTVPAANIH